MKFIPPTRFILVVLVKSLKEVENVTESGVIVVDSTDNPAAMGKVLDIRTDKHNGADGREPLAIGDVLYFNPNNFNPIRLEPGKMHGVVFDEAVLGWAPTKSQEVELRFVGSLGNPVQAAGKSAANVFFGGQN